MQNAELRQSGEDSDSILLRCRDFYYFAPAGCVILDRDGTIRHANLAAAELLGVECSMLPNQRFQPFVSETCRSAFGDFLRGVFACDTRKTEWVILKDEIRPKVLRLEAKAFPTGQECGLVLVDDAGQQHIELALRESETTTSAILNASTESMFLLDTEGVCLAANSAAALRLGKRVDEVLGKSIFGLISPDLARKRKSRFHEVIRSGKAVRFEDEIAGTILDNNFCPIVGGDGKVTGIAVFSSDITHRKRVENSLRESSQFNAQIITSAQEGIVVYDRALRYRVWNPFMEQLTGYPARDVLGRHPLEVFPSMAGGVLIAAVERVLAGEVCGNFEIVYRNSDTGQDVWLADSVAALRNTRGEITGVIALVRDVTKQKLAEEMLLKSEKHKSEAEKLAATGRLAARIAHEINNPLAGIANAFRLFKDAVPKDRPEYRYVDRAEREIDRVARIVRQMYDLHRPNQERESQVLLNEAVGEIILMLEPLGREHHVCVEFLPPVTQVSVHLPEGALRQIIFCLLANAIEASPQHGIVRVGVIVEGPGLVLSVSDRGCGIPERLRTQIFEPFFSTKTGKGTEGGLGLGLATARQLAEALGGKLDYESEVGHGSTFRLHLPDCRIRGVES